MTETSAAEAAKPWPRAQRMPAAVVGGRPQPWHHQAVAEYDAAHGTTTEPNSTIPGMYAAAQINQAITWWNERAGSMRAEAAEHEPMSDARLAEIEQRANTGCRCDDDECVTDLRQVLDRDVPALVAEVRALLAERERLIVERDLAIAHDRQPYPTADAYEAACAALHGQRERAELAEAKLAGVDKFAVAWEGAASRLVHKQNGRINQLADANERLAARAEQAEAEIVRLRALIADEHGRLSAQIEHDTDTEGGHDG